MPIAERFRVMMQLFGVTAQDQNDGADSLRTANGSLVTTLGSVVGAEAHFEDSNASNVWSTGQRLQIGGASRMRIQFIQLNTTTTCQALYVVFNALNDGDAAAKLALAETRDDVIRIGSENEYFFPSNGLCTRVDWITDQAIGGSANIVRFDYTV